MMLISSKGRCSELSSPLAKLSWPPALYACTASALNPLQQQLTARWAASAILIPRVTMETAHT